MNSQRLSVSVDDLMQKWSQTTGSNLEHPSHLVGVPELSGILWHPCGVRILTSSTGGLRF